MQHTRLRVGLAAVLVLFALITLYAQPGYAATTFKATGDFELIPGGNDQYGDILVRPRVSQVQVSIPAGLAKWVTGVDAYDTQALISHCKAVTGHQLYTCTTTKPTIADVQVAYFMGQISPGDYGGYPQKYAITVTDQTTKKTATVHTTIRPNTDLVVHGPYVGNVPPTGGGVVVYVENQGFSDTQGYTITITVTGAVTTVVPSPDCTAAGTVVTCEGGWQSLYVMDTFTVAVGTDSGAIQATAKVTPLDYDPDMSNDSESTGPWTVFTKAGTPAQPPPPPPPVVRSTTHGVPTPGPTPVSSALVPSAAPVAHLSPSAVEPPVVRVVAVRQWGSPFVYYLAVAFLCGASLFFVLRGAALVHKRIHRRPAAYVPRGDVDIDLDR
jgi:hypothetical protein